MTNLGFHRLMEERGIRVVTTDVGDRYVLEALHREGGILGGEQSGHIICLRDHVTGDGLASALLLCDALQGRTLSEAAAVMAPYPQAKQNLPRIGRGPLPQALMERRRPSTASSTGTGVCSSVLPERSPSCEFSQKRRRRKRPKPSVLGSPRSSTKSSADLSRDEAGEVS